MKIKFRNYHAFLSVMEFALIFLILLVLSVTLMCIPLKLLGLVTLGWVWIFSPWVVLIAFRVFDEVFYVTESKGKKL